MDDEVFSSWYEDAHKDNISHGGGSKNGESNINKKGTKKLVRTWQDKGEPEINLMWLLKTGFKRRWDKDVGYRFTHRISKVEVPVTWFTEFDHTEFKSRVMELMKNGF